MKTVLLWVGWGSVGQLKCSYRFVFYALLTIEMLKGKIALIAFDTWALLRKDIKILQSLSKIQSK